MTIQYSTTHRTNNVTDIVTQAGGSSYLLIYTGSPPTNCAAAASGTLLASLPCNATLGSVASGVLTVTPASLSAAAVATGTAGYWRLCTSSAGTTVVAQGTVAQTGGDLNFAAGVSFTAGETISVSSFTITANGA